jgi:hypothetical protein
VEVEHPIPQKVLMAVMVENPEEEVVVEVPVPQQIQVLVTVEMGVEVK